MSSRPPATTDEDVEDPPTSPSQVVVVDDELVDGRYKVVRQLGKGGMSVVYLAEHVDLHRPVALKILRPPKRTAGLVDFQAWFRREARTLASIQHPNVVALYDFGKLGPDAFFLAMEYLDGPSLAKLLKEGPLEPQRAIKLVAQACRALRHTHSRGVVHRDVKPSNLIVTTAPDGQEVVKVIDFGIADAGGEPDASDDVLVGSPHCMAPEQIERKLVGPSADLYAMGVVLYRAVSGRWPFTGSSRRETLLAHLTQTPPSLLQVVPDLDPPELAEVVRRCLARDPAERYADAGALLHDLVLLMGDEASVFDTSTMVAPTIEIVPLPREDEPASRRLPLLLAGAAGLAAVLGGLWWATRGDPSADGAPGEVATATAPVEAPGGSAEPEPAAAPAPAPAPAPQADEPEREPAPTTSRAASSPRPSRPKGGSADRAAPKKAPTTDGADAPKGYKEMPEF